MVQVGMPRQSSPDEQVVRLMHVLSHVTRVRILRAFFTDDAFSQAGDEPERALSPSHLAEEMDEPLGNVSYHVRQLVNEKVLVMTDTKPRRGAVEHFYRPAIDVGPLLRAFDELARVTG
jgi:DNA-binding transcriptional ArsR family regulator